MTSSTQIHVREKYIFAIFFYLNVIEIIFFLNVFRRITRIVLLHETLEAFFLSVFKNLPNTLFFFKNNFYNSSPFQMWCQMDFKRVFDTFSILSTLNESSVLFYKYVLKNHLSSTS